MSLKKRFTCVSAVRLATRISDSFHYRRALLEQLRRSRRHNRSVVVSIFGSCRQDSLSKYFDVTKIRDSLTFPHYTKEIIQAIKYCKSAGIDTPKDLRVFRNVLLGKTLGSPFLLQKEFMRTEIFVVEIASLLEYKKGSDYFHHVAVDTVEEIQVSQQTFDDLFADIVEIVSLLSPKPVVFVTHYSTQKTGLRAGLAQFISEVCKELDVPCINPSNMNNCWDVGKLHEHEEVISHFSKLGHELMADRYREIVLASSLRHQKSLIVQKYRPGLVLHDYHGLGDFIFGSLRLHQEAISRDKQAFIDISLHPMSNFTESHYSNNNAEFIPIVDESQSELFCTNGTVFTHLRPLRKITMSDVDFVLRNSLTPNSGLNDRIDRRKETLDISEKPYSILHLRFGDEFIDSANHPPKEIPNALIGKIAKFLEGVSEDRKTLISSDSNFALATLSDWGFFTLNGHTAHFGRENQDLLGIEDTLINFMIIKSARHIYQASNYGWGSGFSECAGLLGQVPITKLSIDEITR